jgi:hypothetical protein
MQPSTNKNTTISSMFKRFLVTGIWIAIIVAIAYNRVAIQDWWALRDYQAPVAISQLASANTMTDYGQKLFYINKPEISDKARFNDVCPDHSREQTIVLGCYHGGQRGIYLLNVTDPRLKCVIEVTAAHEMLHGAYERLDAGERTRIDGLLQDYYKNSLKDPRILGIIESYKKTEPNDVVNEMHSIFATEIETLPPDLEAYYKQYFNNRNAVVKFASQYQQEFTTRQTAIVAYDAQLNTLKQQIEAGEAQLDSQLTQIESQNNRLTSLRNSNVAAYNAAVPGYNQLVDSYNANIERVRTLITSHNEIVAKRNALAVEQDELYQQLDSKQAPINN